MNNYIDKIVIGFLLIVMAPVAYFFMQSSYWAAMVPVGTALIGLLSMEDIKNKLMTMADASMSFGLLGTLVGLGPIIGPAIAKGDKVGIGYGLAVVVQTTIFGILIAIIMNAIVARVVKNEKKN